MTDLSAAAEQLTEARQAHAAATERHAAAIGRAARAAENHRSVLVQRERMLDAASRGDDVTVDDLRRASIAASEAEDTADLLRALRDGAVRSLHDYEIGLMRAMVADHDSRVDTARGATVAAAELVDQAIAEARVRLGDFLAALSTLRTLDAEASGHNTHVLDQALARNEVLAGLHPSQRPRMNQVPTFRPVIAVGMVLGGDRSMLGTGARSIDSLAALTLPATV